MSIGRVKWFDQLKGYGYILQQDGVEIYFHYTAVADSQKDLPVGLSVTYDLIETRSGLEAANVRRAA